MPRYARWAFVRHGRGRYRIYLVRLWALANERPKLRGTTIMWVGGAGMARERFAEHNIVAVFSDSDAARQAMVALQSAGVDEKDMSLVGRQVAEAKADHDPISRDTNMAKDIGGAAGKGAAMGLGAGAIAGLIGGAIAFGIPGIGPVVGSGIWASVLGGAAAGAAVGGVTGPIATMGMDDDWGDSFHDALKENRVLLAVHADTQTEIETAVKTLDGKGALSVQRIGANGRPVTVGGSEPAVNAAPATVAGTAVHPSAAGALRTGPGAVASSYEGRTVPESSTASPEALVAAVDAQPTSHAPSEPADAGEPRTSAATTEVTPVSPADAGTGESITISTRGSTRDA